MLFQYVAYGICIREEGVTFGLICFNFSTTVGFHMSPKIDCNSSVKTFEESGREKLLLPEV